MFLSRQGDKYREIASFMDIHGFISENEATALYDLAKGLPSEHVVVVEIGSLVGRSSFILAKAIMDKQSSVLYCIDPFRASLRTRSKSLTSLRPFSCNLQYKDLFVSNMVQHKVLDVIRILEGYSHQFSSTFGLPIDLLFIDGNHKYKSVLRDVAEWSPYVKAGGYIALHDVYFDLNMISGPMKVVKQYLLNTPERNNQHWVQQRFVDCLFYARKL